MGKKKKKLEVKLSDQELVPSTIGYLEESKSGPFGLFLLFAVFIAVAIFLPNITEYVNKLLGRSDVELETPIVEVEENKTDEKKIIDVMHDLSDGLEFTFNGLKFSNFEVQPYANNLFKYYISFDIENAVDKSVDFSSNKYFIETYDSDSTMLARHIIDDFTSTTSKIITAKSKVNVSLDLSSNEYSNISKILIVIKKQDDYPNYDLELVNNVYTLTCISNTNTINYIFDKNNNLTSIKDTLRVSNDGTSNYSSKLLQSTSLVSKYNNINGVSSNIIELSNGFTMTTDIDVTKVKINELDSNIYYDSNTKVKVIKFEMEARGYSCK